MNSWEFAELLFSPLCSDAPVVPRSDDSHPFQSPAPVISGPDSDEPKRDADLTQTNPCSEESLPEVTTLDDRRWRRMQSNRESARRSRMRKQQHVENLRNQLNRLRAENREIFNQLRVALQHCHRVRKENGRLQSEQTYLKRKLSDIRQIMIFRQLQQLQTPSPYLFNSIVSEQNRSNNYMANNMINT